MRIKKIISICKQSKVIYIFEGSDDIQWLSDGHAIYELVDLPRFDENSLCAAFDIPEKQQDKISFRHLDGLPEGFSFDDIEESEAVSMREEMSICRDGCCLIPCHTTQGITFIDRIYLEPFADVEDEIELYERTTAKGEIYFAVKLGFMLRGIILPRDAIDEDFVQRLKNLYIQCDMTLFNKRQTEENERVDDENTEEYPADTLEAFSGKENGNEHR